MSNANVSSRAIIEAINICTEAINALRSIQKSMQDRYYEAGKGWSDSKYKQLGNIVCECNLSIAKSIRDLDGYIPPLTEIEQYIREYEEFNIIRNISSETAEFLSNTNASRRTVEEIQREYDQARHDLAREEGQYGSNPNHARVGQYSANVERLLRELSEARRARGY